MSQTYRLRSGLLRVGFSFFVAVAVALTLVQIMRYLVHFDGQVPGVKPPFVFEWIEPRTAPPVTGRPDKVKPPPPPANPPTTKLRLAVNSGGHDFTENTTPVVAHGPERGINSSLDGALVVLVMTLPVYPTAALTRGIEGQVLVEFSVNGTGNVFDPRVIESDPPRIFDRAAVDAVLRSRYKPMIVDGRPQVVQGVRRRITFEMEKR